MDIKLTEGWDLDIVNGDLVLTSSTEAIAQHWAQRLKTFLGEWFLDKGIGVPYFQQILKKNFNPVIVDTAFKKESINTPGITQLIQFNLEIDTATRELNLTAKARSTEGIVDFTGVVP